jgi:hypothetical protein
MKAENLKLYNKYKHINNQESIYIGIGNNGFYWFIYKNNNYNISFSILKRYGFDPEQIVKDLNLETYNNGYGGYIKEYEWFFFSKEYIETQLKPILKDKLNNILNR